LVDFVFGVVNNMRVTFRTGQTVSSFIAGSVPYAGSVDEGISKETGTAYSRVFG
jgi:hypothetical protein